MIRVFLNICQMIKIEHSIFALPYAWAGMVLAARGFPPVKPFIFLTLAMVAVRSLAMTFNRIIDYDIDRLNPRTKLRPLVTGAISLRAAWLFGLGCAAVFIGSCALLNDLCFWLSFPAALFAVAYSYLKRLSSLCHYWLGATLGLAPLAGWLAVDSSSMGLAPVMLFLAVTFWVAAFDVYYSFQDIGFDAKAGLHSLPVDLGPHTALAIAGFSHIMTIIFLLLCGLSASLAWPWYVVCLGIACLLLWEHRLVRPDDLTHVNMAFFTLNGIISPVMLAGILLGIYL